MDYKKEFILKAEENINKPIITNQREYNSHT